MREPRHFYAFEYESGRSTTTGQPNERTGSLSTAGELQLFETKVELDAWLLADPKHDSRVAVSRPEARRLHAGMSVGAYGDMLNHRFGVLL